MLAVRPVRSPLEDGIAFMSSANFLFSRLISQMNGSGQHDDKRSLEISAMQSMPPDQRSNPCLLTVKFLKKINHKESHLPVAFQWRQNESPATGRR
jgi:hypothetical protein